MIRNKFILILVEKLSMGFFYLKKDGINFFFNGKQSNVENN